MRHHPILGASVADEAYVKQQVNQALAKDRLVRGMPYALFPTVHGFDVTLLATGKQHPSLLDEAILELKERHDILSSMILLIPDAWLWH